MVRKRLGTRRDSFLMYEDHCTTECKTTEWQGIVHSCKTWMRYNVLIVRGESCKVQKVVKLKNHTTLFIQKHLFERVAFRKRLHWFITVIWNKATYKTNFNSFINYLLKDHEFFNCFLKVCKSLEVDTKFYNSSALLTFNIKVESSKSFTIFCWNGI